jgi:quinol monooxygenase YgiN
MTDRRDVLKNLMAMAMLVIPASQLKAFKNMEEDFPEYGLIIQIIAKPGQRQRLMDLLKKRSESVTGHMGYIVGEDKSNADSIWVVEIWSDQAAQKASITYPEIVALRKKTAPLIARVGSRHEIKPQVERNRA